jgi:sugar phosphate isomerase/epimerase
VSLRYAICNETFEGWDHARVCEFVAATGYCGLEIAPFTLAGRVTDVPAGRRRELRRQADDAGLTIIGLHWLLAKTEGLHLTSPDQPTRQRTAQYLGELARFCRDVGGSLMVLGSPKQRSLQPGVSREQADRYAAETIAAVTPVLEEADVRLCLEPLAPEETDFWNTCDDVAGFVERLGHTHVCLHLDVKAMSSEAAPVAELIGRHAGRAGHFHANDANRRGPGFGATDFRPILAALNTSGYAGWVSVEVFDYSPDPETIARDSLRYLRRCEAS